MVEFHQWDLMFRSLAFNRYFVMGLLRSLPQKLHARKLIELINFNRMRYAQTHAFSWKMYRREKSNKHPT